jgi:glycerate 2-kinase
VNGIDYFLEITNFDDALQKSDLVITGEGSIDYQTLQGKGPFGVAVKAKEKNIPVIGLSGKLDPDEDQILHQYFNALLSINNEPAEFSEALKNTSANLTRTARAIGDFFASGKSITH